MRGIRIEPPTAVEERDNWRILNEVVDELYFKRTYFPGTGVYTSGAAVAMASRKSVVDFPNAGNPAWRWSEERRSRWMQAGIYWKVRYTTDAAGGGNFAVQLQLVQTGAGDNVAAAALYQSPKTLAAPAAANDVAEAEFVDTGVVINGNKDDLGWLFLRTSGDATDTSPDVLRVYSVTVKVLPLW